MKTCRIPLLLSNVKYENGNLMIELKHKTIFHTSKNHQRTIVPFISLFQNSEKWKFTYGPSYIHSFLIQYSDQIIAPFDQVCTLDFQFSLANLAYIFKFAKVVCLSISCSIVFLGGLRVSRDKTMQSWFKILNFVYDTKKQNKKTDWKIHNIAWFWWWSELHRT